MPRPVPVFSGFIGQREIVTTLEELADAALRGNSRLPHVALIGAAGLGKSALAEATARKVSNCPDSERPRNFKRTIAAPGVGQRLWEVLRSAKHHDILFVDEAHAARREDLELLYVAVDRSQTFAADDKGRMLRTRLEPMAEITVMLATNRPGGLPQALLSRLITLELQPYSRVELKTITQAVAAQREMTLTGQAARVVAEHAGTPRAVEQLLEVTQTLRGRDIKQADVEFILYERLGFDKHGTTPHQRELLRALARAPDNQMTSSELVAVLGLDRVHVRDALEPPLVRLGLLNIGPDRRRALTARGRELVAASRQIEVIPRRSASHEALS
jgi:Holliday junction resolvasome RuvABC ATP-dependent DNA helicase subunit